MDPYDEIDMLTLNCLLEHNICVMQTSLFYIYDTSFLDLKSHEINIRKSNIYFYHMVLLLFLPLHFHKTSILL